MHICICIWSLPLSRRYNWYNKQFLLPRRLDSDSVMFRLGTIFYLSYLLFEYPQNLALQRFPVGKWMRCVCPLLFMVFPTYLCIAWTSSRGELHSVPMLPAQASAASSSCGLFWECAKALSQRGSWLSVLCSTRERNRLWGSDTGVRVSPDIVHLLALTLTFIKFSWTELVSSWLTGHNERGHWFVRRD